MTGALSSGSSLNAPVKPTHVSEEVNNLRNQVNLLNESLGILYQRLSIVLRQEELVAPPISEADKMVVGLANEIRIERIKIQDLNTAVKMVTQRLEI